MFLNESERFTVENYSSCACYVSWNAGVGRSDWLSIGPAQEARDAIFRVLKRRCVIGSSAAEPHCAESEAQRGYCRSAFKKTSK